MTPHKPTGPLDLTPHPLRGAVIGEVHARPVQPLEADSRAIRFAFQTSSDAAAADRRALVDFCAARGMEPPGPGRRYHVVKTSDVVLRWEQHAEFTTYTWVTRTRPATRFEQSPGDLAAGMRQLPQPGPLIAAIDLQVSRADETKEWQPLFAAESLAASEVDEGRVVLATDFQASGEGFVRILMVVRDVSLAAVRIGGFAQSLLEIETYRSFALLGLPEAQRLGPIVGGFEASLASITREITTAKGADANERLLERMTALAAQSEAEAAASAFRFGATRAYMSLVQDRLEALKERPLPGLPTLDAFLDRRLVPAMRTCIAIEDRQANLSRKLSRAANLLRTRVEVALQQSNREVLSAMNERTRLQLRLQQTVEGLSIAAITYYVVGLFSYIARGLQDAGIGLSATTMTAIAVPLALAVIGLMVWRLRRHTGIDGRD